MATPVQRNHAGRDKADQPIKAGLTTKATDALIHASQRKPAAPNLSLLSLRVTTFARDFRLRSPINAVVTKKVASTTARTTRGTSSWFKRTLLVGVSCPVPAGLGGICRRDTPLVLPPYFGRSSENKPDLIRSRAGCDDRSDWCPTAKMGLTDYNPRQPESMRRPGPLQRFVRFWCYVPQL